MSATIVHLTEHGRCMGPVGPRYKESFKQLKIKLHVMDGIALTEKCNLKEMHGHLGWLTV